MKTYLTLIFLILNLFSFSQEDVLYIEPLLEKYVDEFIEEGRERDLNLMVLLFEKLDYILIDNTIEFPILGYYYADTKTVLVSEIVLIDTLITKMVLFHEIGHAFVGHDHTCYNCGDIMAEKAPQSFSIYKDDWEDYLDDFYELIKNNENRNDGGEDTPISNQRVSWIRFRSYEY